MKNPSTLSKVCRLVVVISLATACGTHSHLNKVRLSKTEAQLQLPPSKNQMPQITAPQHRLDTLKVTDPTRGELIIMHAIKDSETGEMVAHDQIEAATVTARFRNLAERNGKVDICFQIVVSDSLQDRNWQVRFKPEMIILGDTTILEPVLFTGSGFRRNQMKGYEQYRRFLNSIARDSTMFIDIHQLELFIKRNMPEIYAFKADSSIVSDSEFQSSFGVSEKQALEHYTNQTIRKINAYKISIKDRKRRRYIRTPISSDGIRIDSIINAEGNSLVYDYIQTVNTRPGLRKIDIVLTGDISDTRGRSYRMPRSSPLSFYISSLSSLTDDSEHYKTMVIERRAEANTACWISFPSASHSIDINYGNNSSELKRIQSNIASLLENRDFDLDSIVVSSSSSPEGRWEYNRQLSQRRAEAVVGHVSAFMKTYSDSLRADKGVVIDMGGIGAQEDCGNIALTARSVPENWEMLSALVESDTLITDSGKETYLTLLRSEKDPDLRERKMLKLESYRYMREHLYPKVRVTRFAFHLHRKGMVKDTVHTTIPDTLYRIGVQALKDHDYHKALDILRPYSDYNTALALMALDYNESARIILERLSTTAETEYMLALVCSRQGNHEQALQHYVNACSMKQAFIHRGNLDPEISELLRLYGKESDFLGI